MTNNPVSSTGGYKMEKTLELTRKCLTLISRIAARGACSPDPEHIVDTLMELTYALSEPLYSTRNGVRELDRMHRELDFIDSTFQEFTARHVLKYALRSTWN